MSYYGNLILRERLARSWSQAGLCKDICTVSYLSKIETGKAQPSADVLRLLLARLGLHTDPALEAAGARCAEDGYERLFTGRFGELAAALPAVSDETYRATAAWTDILLLRQFDTDGGALDAGLEAGMTQRQLAMQRLLQGRWHCCPTPSATGVSACPRMRRDATRTRWSICRPATIWRHGTARRG